jgi:hypothetical protein
MLNIGECIICYQETDMVFNPNNRPKLCVCQYRIHDICYKSWLQKSNTAFHCVICHAEIKPNTEIRDILCSFLPLLLFLVFVSILLIIFIFVFISANVS